MRAAPTSILLAALLAAPACEAGSPWTGGSDPATDEVAPDFGPTAAYNRRLLFLGSGTDLPTAAVFDFVALSDSAGIRRGARARVVVDTAWRVLMDDGWEMDAMREPWRLVPHGPLKMVVGEGGDLGALVVRDTSITRLELGPTIAEHSPDVGTQLVLRNARLGLDGAAVDGVLLDAQLGRAVSPMLASRTTRAAALLPDTAGPGAEADTAGPAAGSVAAFGAPSATPIARPGAEALLLGGAGYYAVLATASSGSLVWIRSAGQDDVRGGTTLEPTAWSSDAGGAQVPTAWRIVSGGTLEGELTARSTDPVLLDGPGGVDALAYVLVDGWLEDRSVRRDVHGLVRHVR